MSEEPHAHSSQASWSLSSMGRVMPCLHVYSIFSVVAFQEYPAGRFSHFDGSNSWGGESGGWGRGASLSSPICMSIWGVGGGAYRGSEEVCTEKKLVVVIASAALVAALLFLCPSVAVPSPPPPLCLVPWAGALGCGVSCRSAKSCVGGRLRPPHSAAFRAAMSCKLGSRKAGRVGVRAALSASVGVCIVWVRVVVVVVGVFVLAGAVVVACSGTCRGGGASSGWGWVRACVRVL